MVSCATVTVREVWAHNLESEIQIIQNLVDTYYYVSMDTEFPGVVFKTQSSVRAWERRRQGSAVEQYRLLKLNVDALNIIQIGLTLSDPEGNLPDVGESGGRYIWQFNFSDFDLARDLHAPDSVLLLHGHGIDFNRTRELGIDSARFGELIMSSGLLCNEWVSWVTFHGAYDFGYFVKILKQSPLPDRLEDFLGNLTAFFGSSVYDVKHMMKFCERLCGGLDRLAKSLDVDRVVGQCHQAGSDSLLTWHVFQKMRDVYFHHGGGERFVGVLFGLEVY
ncbi:unnamed protein product [Cuscuta epithymum]|uniref:poly(A)-specific ribonuclease n=1 Tax=Cuscuta epithymum TaxID=186058 RepID=A0AAV0DA59_9ASTE|nr:unnamed protein product [Cuscuta epithymum]